MAWQRDFEEPPPTPIEIHPQFGPKGGDLFVGEKIETFDPLVQIDAAASGPIVEHT
jgi:hypothetical protein